jgi:hypothetical protein
VTFLYQSFERLRAQRFWKAKVKGGAAVCEIKIGEGSGKWHVHLHLLAEASYIPKDELREAWRTASVGSYVVDIARVFDVSGQAAYLCKYLTKPADESVWRAPDRFIEAVLALRGRRLCGTFGAWRGCRLEDRPADPGDWVQLCSLNALLRGVREGNKELRKIAEILAGCGHVEEHDSGGGGSADSS